MVIIIVELIMAIIIKVSFITRTIKVVIQLIMVTTSLVMLEMVV